MNRIALLAVLMPMNWIKYITLSLLCSIPFCACSTSDLYYQPLTESPSAPWEKSSSRWGGYIDNSKGSSHQVTYKAYNNPSAEAAAYFARLRAAERTITSGKRYFYSKKSTIINTHSEVSHFPAHTIPGYWETERYKDCHRCPDTGKQECHYDYERVWYPPEYVPDRYVTNYIHSAEINYKYSGSLSQRYDAYQIIQEALADRAGFGKPKLDPRVQEKLNSLNNKTRSKTQR